MLWLKSLHIGFVTSRFAGLLHPPRILVRLATPVALLIGAVVLVVHKPF